MVLLVLREASLHPAVSGIFAGATIGLACAALRYAAEPTAFPGLWALAEAFILNLLLIPFLHRASPIDNDVFPLNGVVWSMFFEVVANLLYAAIGHRWGVGVLAGIVLVCLGALIGLAGSEGDLGGTNRDNFLLGFARAFFSFFAGVLIYRLRDRTPALAIPPWASAIVLVGLFSIPRRGPVPELLLQIGMIVVIFPLLIIGSLSVQPTGAVAWLCRTGGALSYPLYGVHWPLLVMIPKAVVGANVLWSVRGFPIYAALAVASIAIAWLVLRYYDGQVRAWLLAKEARGGSVHRGVSAS